MKTILIALAIMLAMTTSASELVEQKQAAPSDILNRSQSRPKSDNADLKNQVVQLQIELRETKRKYYAAKTELKKLQSATQPVESDNYTGDQVEQFITDAQNEIYYGGLVYSVAEREFLLSLTTIEDMQWLLSKMHSADLERIVNLKGSDETYKDNIKEVIADYKSYFEANNQPPQEAAQ